MRKKTDPLIDRMQPHDGRRLLVIVVLGVVDHVVEAQLVDALGRRHDAQPVAQLVLLEKLLGPVGG